LPRRHFSIHHGAIRLCREANLPAPAAKYFHLCREPFVQI
jgi:hypothetical protein